jgi:formate hydrogenlyase transcriptional activator
MMHADRVQKPITAISEEFMAALARHPWPGNIRELQNFIERSVILSTGPVLNGSLPEVSRASKESAPVTMEQADRSHILQTLLRTEGVVGGPNGAAARLGLKRTTLISMMRRLGINSGRSLALQARSVASVHELGGAS